MNPHNDDPFFMFSSDSDRTVIRPIPGGRTQDIQQRGLPKSPPVQTISLDQLSKINPLINVASTLLGLAASLYGRPSHPAPKQLRQQLSVELRQFQQQASQVGIDRQTIQLASHALCTTLDEAIFNTPWGQEAGWAEHSLLSEFHSSVAGGDEFFQHLRDLGNNPTQNLHLLELMYLALSFGFKGRYQLVQDGKTKLEQIQSWLVQLIRQQRGTSDKALSPHWQGVEAKNRGVKRFIPLWGIYALSAAVAVLAFSGFLLSLGANASPIKQKINEINFAVNTVAPAPVVPAIGANLKQFLAPEIQANLVSVGVAKNGRPLIRLRGEQGLFQSGSDVLLTQREAVVNKIADALADPRFAIGALTVIGHTDNVPLSNRIRFNDNFDLSKARAESVKQLLVARQPKLKISVQGKGPMESIGDNKTPEGRSVNRRVEIILD